MRVWATSGTFRLTPSGDRQILLQLTSWSWNKLTLSANFWLSLLYIFLCIQRRRPTYIYYYISWSSSVWHWVSAANIYRCIIVSLRYQLWFSQLTKQTNLWAAVYRGELSPDRCHNDVLGQDASIRSLRCSQTMFRSLPAGRPKVWT